MAVLCACTGLVPTMSGGTTPRGDRANSIAARVTDVIDGDTIRVRTRGVRSRLHTVQLIGIDAPEMRRPDILECGGKQATSNMLELTFSRPLDADGDHFFDTGAGTGRRVTLTTDRTQGRFDRRRRLLAYVSTAGGIQLQVDQLIRGWAQVHVSARRFRRHARFRRAESDAKRVDHGVWSKCGGDFHRPA